MTAKWREEEMKMLPHNIRLSHKKMLPRKMRSEASSEVEAASQNGAPSLDEESLSYAAAIEDEFVLQ